MSGQIDKEFRPLVAELRKLGCEIEHPRKGRNHFKIRYRGRLVGSLPTSCSNRAAVGDAIRQLRTHGVPIPSGWPKRR